MGTMIQRYWPRRGGSSAASVSATTRKDLRGNNDLLTLTRPQVIREIHAQYLEAGADILETNTFNSTSISQADYELEAHRRRDELRSARGSRARWPMRSPRARRRSRASSRACSGPMNRTLSLSPDVNDPGYRAVTFDQVKRRLQGRGEGAGRRRRGPAHGRDDLRHAQRQGGALRHRRVLRGVGRAPADHDLGHDHRRLGPHALGPDRRRRSGIRCATRGRFPSASTARSAPSSCAPTWRSSRASPTCYVSAHPNAGLPNAMAEYDELPAETAGYIREWAESGWLNITGGCCGTTPDHIRAIAEIVSHLQAARGAEDRAEAAARRGWSRSTSATTRSS